MTYKEKLKSPKWQKKRLEILNRDEWKCQLCMNDKKTLVVHHKKYINGKNPWDYHDNFLITLCDQCHNKFHEKLNDGADLNNYDESIWDFRLLVVPEIRSEYPKKVSKIIKNNVREYYAGIINLLHDSYIMDDGGIYIDNFVIWSDRFIERK